MEKSESRNEPRIGVYICHCGTNIAGVVNVKELVEYAKSLHKVVVARDYKYMCSDPGQDLIKKDIRGLNLNRVVVAACSPHLHEKTFRNAVKTAGLNPFFFQMASIREHVSWVTNSREKATEKAKAAVNAAVRRVVLHEALEIKQVPVLDKVLVVGGGIAGITASLVLANSGKQVYLVEKEPSIGGHMAMFDKTFPTLDCASCILTPKMTAVKENPNIKLISYAEVEEVDGFVGDFKVKVKKKPRYVIEDACVGCRECIEACVFKEPKFPNEFDLGLGKRKPVYIPFPQAVPLVATIDPETCLYLRVGKCKLTCVEACGDRNAIDFEQKPKEIELNVGTIILSTGYKTFDATRISQYGYGKYPNVYTSLEIERLINSAGPTGGEIILRDGRRPQSVAIIHCVGSRDKNYNEYCSKVCCMYSLKLAHLIKDRTGAGVFNFYIDIRAAGKGYEEFYHRILEEGVRFIRGKVSEITMDGTSPEEKGKLLVRAEDSLAGEMLKVPVDMVILSIAIEPTADADEIRRMFSITCSAEGWFLERHPKLAPVSTYTDGIFIAGCAQGPKDIPDSVAQAGAAASEALALMDRGIVELEPNTAFIDEEICSGCHLCIAMCPYSAISYDKEKKVAVLNEALCKGCGACVATCPSGAAQQNLFLDSQIFAEIEGVLVS